MFACIIDYFLLILIKIIKGKTRRKTYIYLVMKKATFKAKNKSNRKNYKKPEMNIQNKINSTHFAL